ncbi:D-2-hydroxyglutarate dehydrogenase, mitochondrial-like [Branchiostoma floridae x Branchiostoma belcheri]
MRRNVSQVIGYTLEQCLSPRVHNALFAPSLPLRYTKGRNDTIDSFDGRKRWLHGTATLAQKPRGVQLSSERFPQLKRGDFARVTDSDLQVFERLVPSRVLTDLEDIEGHNVDWSGTCRGDGQVLLRPKTTEEVSAVLRYCSGRRLAVVPQGGNTGLVGGSVPVFDEVIISLSLMDNIISLDEISGVLVCQAGCVVDKINGALEPCGLMTPHILGSKGSCQIGGNISTNAGGLRMLRYGNLHGNVLGVEAVLANGDVVDCMSTLRKDNTGYDLKQLFIGSEGSLGVVTAASLLCPRVPAAVSVALLGCDSFAQVLQTYDAAKRMLQEILSAVEFMDRASMEVVQENLHLTCPLGTHSYYLLVETSGSNAAHDEEKLNSLLGHVMEKGIVDDGTVATEPSKVQTLWALRENVAVALRADGCVYKYDVTVPMSRFYDLVADTRKRMGTDVTRVVGYGHLGESDIHLNVTCPQHSEDVFGALEPWVYDWVAKYKGSVSAEHGMGILKRDYLYHSNTGSAVLLMKQLKKLMDPKGILNPYKIFPD